MAKYLVSYSWANKKLCQSGFGCMILNDISLLKTDPQKFYDLLNKETSPDKENLNQCIPLNFLKIK